MSIPLVTAAAFAICGASLLALNISPSATFFNQAISLAGWGLFLIAVLVRSDSTSGEGGKRSWPAVVALMVTGLGVVLSGLFERLPSTLVLSALGLLSAAMLVMMVSAQVARTATGDLAFHAFCAALLVAALLSLGMALVQTFAPHWADGDWIARVAGHGRAGGNLRQPNHLSSLMLWAIVALIWLHDTMIEKERAGRTRAARALTFAALAGLIFGDVLTASRTGSLCIVLLALWGVLNRQLSWFSRVALWLTPLIYALCWFSMAAWSHAAGQGFAGSMQLQKSDPSSSRFAIWANAVELAKQNPWLGVGWGEFNFAWSLTPFPDRPMAFFDHTHNLPLQFIVELGIPLGTLVLLLLAWSLWKAFAACRLQQGLKGSIAQASLVIVLMMVVHSMLEYPLWYAYFLLPTAFALGTCLGLSSQAMRAGARSGISNRVRQTFVGACLVLVGGTGFALVDYLRVAAIFSTDEDTPLSRRIAEGQKSVFFAHHADYALATVSDHPSTAWRVFRRAPHFLLDTRLMIAWANAYAEKGDVERARYLADRLREFRNPDSADFFAMCDKPMPAGLPAPYQCTPATRQFTYQDFKLR
jgi:O-antigen ligase